MSAFRNICRTPVVIAMVLFQYAEASRVQPKRVAVNKGKGSSFECPDQCLECCDASWLGGLVKKEFKCLLRDTSRLPAEGYQCSPATRRKSNTRQYKTQCKYIGDGERATEKTCSSKFQCCCADDNNWVESRCFDGAQSGLRKEVANKNGQMESFKMAYTKKSNGQKMKASSDAQVYSNVKMACQAEGNTHHVYDLVGPIFISPNRRPKETSPHQEGCCLKVTTVTVDHKWESHKLSFINNGDQRVKVETNEESRTYIICEELEKLHACSDDGGLTPNGQFAYERVAPKVEGKCVGNVQTTDVGTAALRLEAKQRNGVDGYCPASMSSGPWCSCEKGCLEARKSGD